MKKFIIIIIALVVVVGAVYLILQFKQNPKQLEKACIDSGGKVSTASCCQMTSDFPNTCAIGACGCASNYSKEVKICDCGDGCWDGTKCVGNQQPTDKYANLPLERARDRVLKKPFGIKINPQNSPVQPERFSGYHTGNDYEIFAGEENIDVSVFAICEGKLLEKKMANGYGGMLIQACDLGSQPITVVYGHARLSSVKQNIGDNIIQGEQLAVLGKGYSTETDGERKHLHLGVHKGTVINSRGYVSTQAELINWIDFEEYLKSVK